ncbi:hypothetical protein BC828DRAFT_438490 [Blastocladiella britannica]|nr:hypothetical protein BC828DRAFT_438490 [Blastocladiella britannica]
MAPSSWSTASFTSGVSVALDVSTVVASISLYRGASQSHFYLWLALAAFVHIVDQLGNDLSVVWNNGFDDENKPIPNIGLNVLGIIAAMCGGVGFVTLNMSRFYSIGITRMPAMTRVLAVATAVSVLLCVANNVMYVAAFIAQAGNKDSGLAALIPKLDTVFTIWSIYDSLVNLSISMAFLSLLKNMSIASGATSLRKGFTDMLVRVQWVLVIEAGVMVLANLYDLFLPDLDSDMAAVYIAESLRLRMFVMFLLTLSRMLKKKIPPSNAASTTMNGNPNHRAGLVGGAFPLSTYVASKPMAQQHGQHHHSSSGPSHNQSSSGDYATPL